MLLLAEHLAERNGRLDEDRLAWTMARQNRPRAGSGLLHYRDLSRITEMARRAAAVTHTHPLARDAAALTTGAVALAQRGLPNGSVSPERFLAAITRIPQDPEYDHYLSVVGVLTRHRAGAEEAVATLNAEQGALRAVAAALTAFLRHYEDPLAAIQYALSLGGQARAIAVITAALVGARRPSVAPPAAWAAQADLARIDAVTQALQPVREGSR